MRPIAPRERSNVHAPVFRLANLKYTHPTHVENAIMNLFGRNYFYFIVKGFVSDSPYELLFEHLTNIISLSQKKCKAGGVGIPLALSLCFRSWLSTIQLVVGTARSYLIRIYLYTSCTQSHAFL